MFSTRLLVNTVFRTLKSTNALLNKNYLIKPSLISSTYKHYSTALLQNFYQKPQPSLLQNDNIVRISNEINSRTVTKYSIRKGRRKSVKTVLKRFYRLHWGGWIRTIAGRHRRIWSKSYTRRMRVKQHVFCNATQCTLLDKMVGSYWRKPKYYVDDIYEPYHTREEFQFTYKKPRPYIPSE
ncbi:hypothetical protein RN001_011431 [Aquatica leii]|uniref:Large ribosomal subunit protein bL35m n=1 Tax=Aquatica leii TaxID=1421715 RepID=A0AAN7SEI9_9COLE|nr:hypothetical protein RN001_011431 [Aquatica leii]